MEQTTDININKSISPNLFNSDIKTQSAVKNIESFINTENRDRESVDDCYEESGIENICNDFFKKMNIHGRRIVDINYFLKEFVDVCKRHNSSLCCNSQLRPVKCRDEGLGTNVLIKCDNCNFKNWIASEPREKNVMKINTLAVLSTLVTGTCYDGLRRLFAGIDIPCMSHVTYMKHRRTLVPVIEKAANEEMIKAGKLEKEIAIRKGHVINGIPWIEVQGDGGYGKRSYRTGKHDSLVCVGSIIGVETNKLLHVEIRNKYCLICFKAARKKITPKKHVCYKNWNYNKSSSSMETDCNLKGFQKSIEIHGLIYKTYVGDGDSSTYKTIQERNVYKEHNVQVGRLYCTNHLYRNMCNKIVDISKGRLNHGAIRGNVLNFRDFIKHSAFKIRKLIAQHVERRRKQNVPDEIKNKELQRDILNAVPHTFGQHINCKNRGLTCKKDKNSVPILKSCGVYECVENVV